MADFQIPGGPYVVDNYGGSYQIAGGPYVINPVAAPAAALVLISGEIQFKAAPAPTDRRLFLNNGARIAKTTAGTGDRLLTLGAGGAWQAGAAAP